MLGTYLQHHIATARCEINKNLTFDFYEQEQEG